jgi:hypothetical protein
MQVEMRKCIRDVIGDIKTMVNIGIWTMVVEKVISMSILFFVVCDT